MKTALLLIDIQNDYFTGGRNPLVNVEQAADQAKRALAYFCNNNLPVFHIQHISLQDGAAFFLPDTDGCKIYQGVLPEAAKRLGYSVCVLEDACATKGLVWNTVINTSHMEV